MNPTLVRGMRRCGLWFMLGCLLLWGGGAALPSSPAAADTSEPTQRSHALAAKQAGSGALDAAEVTRSEALAERLRPVELICDVPRWQQLARRSSDWTRDPVVPAKARRATAPPLAGIVELLI